tara:strand:- start:10725 stop:10892 length:168 start_codon:yes stop_codon:yes gene_type:complete
MALTPEEFQERKDKVSRAILELSAKKANAVFWEVVKDMTDSEVSEMMGLIAKEHK